MIVVDLLKLNSLFQGTVIIITRKLRNRQSTITSIYIIYQQWWILDIVGGFILQMIMSPTR